MPRRINDFFRLTISQYRGLLILSFVLFVSVVCIFLSPDKQSTKLELLPISSDANQMDQKRGALFEFDPSSADSATFSALGFDSKQIRTIINFRKAIGGRFENKEHFAKCYAVPDSVFKILEPYIRIGQAPKKPKSSFDVDINSISLSKLKTHSDVDSRMADKLFRSRVRYGGFVSMDQMLEIFKNDSLVIRQLQISLLVDTTALVRYEVNIDSVDMLSEHPYITHPFAESIVKYRDAQGQIKNFEELKNLKYFPKSKEKYLRYYLVF